jgi:hypothetical protein
VSSHGEARRVLRFVRDAVLDIDGDEACRCKRGPEEDDIYHIIERGEMSERSRRQRSRERAYTRRRQG